jgi:hypothetical protein
LPTIVNVSVEATDKVALAFISRLLIVAFAAEIEVADAGLTWQSLVELGAWCGLQLSLSKKFRLCPPIHLSVDMDASCRRRPLAGCPAWVVRLG